MDNKRIRLENPAFFLPNFEEQIWPKLWNHQKKAINEISGYVRSIRKQGKKTSKLIAHPTGSGKSGIIASIARFMKFDGPILIVVPRRELRNQIASDLSGRYRKDVKDRGRFFEHARVNLDEAIEGNFPRNVLKIEEIEDLKFGDDGDLSGWKQQKPIEEQFILVTTIQLLTTVWRNSGNLQFKRPDSRISGSQKRNLNLITQYIKTYAGLIIFDEGHYEPAPSWSEVIRSINVPRIIFTATPFRNDLRGFDWESNNPYFVTFKEMEEEHKKIRGIKIERTDLPPLDMSKTIEIIEKRRQKLVIELGEEVEVIIRVGSRARIKEVISALGQQGLSHLAIHDRPQNLSKTEPNEEDNTQIVRDYPLSPTKKITYWVHQYKLLEGIDRPQISMLVILDRLKTMRALVQQIGRLTRRTFEGKSRPYALILDSSGDVAKQWERFLEFEEILKKTGFQNRTAEYLVNTILSGLTSNISPIYSEGWPKDVLTPRKRNREDDAMEQQPEEDGPWNNIFPLDYSEDLIVETNTQILKFVNSPATDWPLVIHDVISSSREAFNRIWRVQPLDSPDAAMSKIDERTLIILGVSSNASPYLKSHVFFDIKLEITLIYRSDPYVFVYDSLGRNFKGITQYLTYGNARSILQQLKQFDEQMLRSISLTSSRHGKGVVLSQTKNAVDLTSVPASLSDPTQIVSAARGFVIYDDDDVRLRNIDEHTDSQENTAARPFPRRIGVSTRRITDYGSRITIKDFCEWAESLATSIRANDKGGGTRDKVVANYLERFSTEATSIPKGWQPTWLYLDLAKFEMEYVNATGKTKFPYLEDSLIEIGDDGSKFKGMIKVIGKGVQDLSIEIKFNKNTGKYSLESEELDSYRPANRSDGFTILQVLNQETAFSILPRDTKYFYTMGAFYTPGIRFGKEYDDSQTGLLSTLVKVKELKNIRSEKGDKKDFAKGAVTWPQTSLFGIVDAAARNSDKELTDQYSQGAARRLQEYLGNVSWMVCDDMGSERADFILLTERNKEKYVILIHAKAKSIGKKAKPVGPSYLSAKGLSDVCMQAIKNLDFFGPRIADHSRNWDQDWTIDKSIGIGLPRIRVWPRNGRQKSITAKEISQKSHLPKDKRLALRSEAETEFEKAINNPSVQREVWLLTGGILSYDALENLLHQEKPSYEDIPIVYTLFGVSTTIAAAPAKLRVFSF